MKEMGFEICANDNCLLKRETAEGLVMICLYVDDLMCIGDKEAILKAVKDIQKQYTIKINEEKSDSEFIGVTYEKVGDDILISQPDTIKKLEKQFGPEVEQMKTYQSPARAGEHIVRLKEGDHVNPEEQKNYRSGAGMLLWLMKHSRPNICNATREASKVMDAATMAITNISYVSSNTSCRRKIKSSNSC